jgi:Mn2+/Fe2+ NRAMP family transporter
MVIAHVTFTLIVPKFCFCSIYMVMYSIPTMLISYYLSFLFESPTKAMIANIVVPTFVLFFFLVPIRLMTMNETDPENFNDNKVSSKCAL